MNSSNHGCASQRKRMFKNVSCITLDADCGEYDLKGVDYFDVPAQEYAQGNLTGEIVLCEMLKEAA